MLQTDSEAVCRIHSKVTGSKLMVLSSDQKRKFRKQPTCIDKANYNTHQHHQN